jgi:tRNA pseudouridine38-40 synthase
MFSYNDQLKYSHSFIVVEVKGESFLWHMVRGIVTALEMVGRNEMTIDQIAELLDGKVTQRVPAAPAANLVLWDVDCGISYISLTIGERHARFLIELQRYYKLMERITGTLLPGN